jgi:FkbM family methyltransferase
MSGAKRAVVAELIGFEGRLEIADIGAAMLGPAPAYQDLLDVGLARLNAFDADARQHAALREAHGEALSLYDQIVGDGAPGTLHLAARESGMSSLLAPSQRHLQFFNNFEVLGRILETIPVQTTRLDDVPGLPDIDVLKMDIQGGEMAVLRHGGQRLARCVAIQLEVSFVPLYENQPTFGEIDVWMRGQGFLPHAFAELKRWSIAPIVRDNDARVPFNQLLEADVVYVRDPTAPERWDDEMIRRLILVAHYAYYSMDLAGRLIQVLQARGAAPPDTLARYLALLSAPA